MRVSQAYQAEEPRQRRCKTRGAAPTSEQCQNLTLLSAERSDTLPLTDARGFILAGAVLVVANGRALLRSFGVLLGAHEQERRRLAPRSGSSATNSRLPGPSRLWGKLLILSWKMTAARDRRRQIVERAAQIERDCFARASSAIPTANISGRVAGLFRAPIAMLGVAPAHPGAWLVSIRGISVLE